MVPAFPIPEFVGKESEMGYRGVSTRGSEKPVFGLACTTVRTALDKLFQVGVDARGKDLFLQ
jgi:hypothetical protein